MSWVQDLYHSEIEWGDSMLGCLLHQVYIGRELPKELRMLDFIQCPNYSMQYKKQTVVQLELRN